MKWIEFIIFLILDALLFAYLVAYLTGRVPPAPGFAKVAFVAICFLVAAGTRITYNEAKNDNNKKNE